MPTAARVAMARISAAALAAPHLPPRHPPPKTHKIAQPPPISANLVTPRPARLFVVHTYPVLARTPRAGAFVRAPNASAGF